MSTTQQIPEKALTEISQNHNAVNKHKPRDPWWGPQRGEWSRQQQTSISQDNPGQSHPQRPGGPAELPGQGGSELPQPRRSAVCWNTSLDHTDCITHEHSHIYQLCAETPVLIILTAQHMNTTMYISCVLKHSLDNTDCITHEHSHVCRLCAKTPVWILVTA